METRERSDGDAVVFMALMFLCSFFLFGMSELECILLDNSECKARELSSYGGVDGILVVELMKEEQEGNKQEFFWGQG